MRMNKRNSLVTFSVVAGIIVFVMALHALGWIRFIENGLSSAFGAIATPFNRVTDALNPRETDALSREELESQLEETRSENRRLLAENATLKETASENETLRQYLAFTRNDESSYVMAGVIARGESGDNWRNRETILLNRGSRNGITAGQPIISDDGMLLGKVIRVEDNLSEACLLYSGDCRIAVAVSGEGSTLGVARGDLGLTVKVDLIEQNRQLGEGGQVIVTAGIEEHMPRGIVIGTISQVMKQPNELWQNALIKPSANFDIIRIVAIRTQ